MKSIDWVSVASLALSSALLGIIILWLIGVLSFANKTWLFNYQSALTVLAEKFTDLCTLMLYRIIWLVKIYTFIPCNGGCMQVPLVFKYSLSLCWSNIQISDQTNENTGRHFSNIWSLIASFTKSHRISLIFSSVLLTLILTFYLWKILSWNPKKYLQHLTPLKQALMSDVMMSCYTWQEQTILMWQKHISYPLISGETSSL